MFPSENGIPAGNQKFSFAVFVTIHIGSYTQSMTRMEEVMQQILYPHRMQHMWHEFGN